ncbi:MAG: hypothetical protein ACPGVU_12845 [Limisphaerales bacterium]
MKKRRHWLIALGLAFVALVIWQVVSSNERNDSKASITIRDVGTLYFERAEYGSNFVYGTSTERFIHGLLGEKRMRLMGMKRPIVVKRGARTLLIWFTLDQPKSKMPSNARFSLANENGYYAGRVYGGHVEEYGSNQTAIGVAFEQFPRDSRALTVKLSLVDDKWEYRNQAEFTFANPLPPATYPALAARRLPWTQTTNGLDVTLQRLAFGVGSDRKFTAAATNEEASTLASFVIQQGGMAIKHWRPADVLLKDSFGDESHANSHGNTRRGTTNFYGFQTGLWPDTNGMKFSWEFSREKEAVFAPHELITLRGIKVPSGTNVTILNLTSNIMGHKITVVGLLGARGKIAGHRRSHSSGISLEVTADPPLLDMRLDLIRVVDEQGREGRSSGKSWSRPTGSYGIGFKLHNLAKEVDVTLAVHPSMFLDFTVIPEILTP